MTRRSNWACCSLSLTFRCHSSPDRTQEDFIPGGITFPAASLGQRESTQETRKTMNTKAEFILHDHNHNGLDRRGFLECMAWAGTGMLWTVTGGLLGSAILPGRAGAAEMTRGTFNFVQISDSHIGFNKDAHKDVDGTLKEAIAMI